MTARASSGVFRGAKTLSLMPTHTCPAACANCASMSGPDVRENLSLDTILSAIGQAKALGFYNVVFTGGEATLRWKDLLTAIRHAHALELPTRLVTNAHWATSAYTADKTLAELLEAGLCEINYSTGDEHTRFIPLERVIRACLAAVRRNFKVWVMVELREQRKVTAASVNGHPLIAALSESEKQLIEVSESPWMPLDPSTIETYPAGAAANRLALKSQLGCSSVLQTYTVQANGVVGSCCGIGMRKIPELNVARVDNPDFLKSAIEEAESDFLKLWIHYKGPEQILAWAAAINPSIQWENMYAHHCQACARLYQDETVRQVIRIHHEEMIENVLQTAWLDEMHAPSESLRSSRSA
ncbi:radical SAM protein [Massilia antarctica]|uniref:Radical SAM protein n=1 Tax=Massilia antarctica TaxID=2765360 RepID=A0AA48WBD5_9BURK|nr:radical SAM protein [Massilia antarctica]QPI49451.1 radical SAM protein [Massilia antarctica]